ncbi:hypothetical protein I7I48_04155 [Histoplasma ohiense]|nr:hypothetical protein I7I48_04155 [Histoplasma ohiense (nom. inval.)]
MPPLAFCLNVNLHGTSHVQILLSLDNSPNGESRTSLLFKRIQWIFILVFFAYKLLISATSTVHQVPMSLCKDWDSL